MKESAMAEGHTSVLAVDDEVHICEIVSEILEESGLEVMTAQSAEEALSLCENKTFDLILTDLKMPGMGGVELIRHVSERYPDTATAILSSHSDVDAARAAISSGVSAYILKPINSEELVATVNRILDSVRVRRERDALHEELAARYQDLRRAEAAREAAIRMVTDELRSPLGLVRTSLEALAGGHAGRLNEDQLAIVEGAFAACERAFHLVDELLSAKLLSEGSLYLKFGPVDIPELLADVAEQSAGRAREVDVELLTDLPAGLPPVKADPEVLRHVVQRLVYETMERGASRVTLTCSLDAGRSALGIVVSCEDLRESETGAGWEGVFFGESLFQLAAAALEGTYTVSEDGRERRVTLKVFDDSGDEGASQ